MCVCAFVCVCVCSCVKWGYWIIFTYMAPMAHGAQGGHAFDCVCVYGGGGGGYWIILTYMPLMVLMVGVRVGKKMMPLRRGLRWQGG